MRKVEVSFGRCGLDSRLLSKLSPLLPLLYFISCVGFFLEIQFLTLDSTAERAMYVALAHSQSVIMVV